MINRNKRAVLWRRRRWRPSLAELALLLLLVAAIGVGVQALGRFIGVKMEDLRDRTIKTLNDRIGRQITYGRISPSLLRAFEIRDLTIFSADNSNEPLVAINRIRIRYSLARLILLRDPVAALREIQLINSDFAVNLDRDLELRQFVRQLATMRAGESTTSTPVDGGSPRLDSFLPIDLSGANLGLVIEDGGYRFNFEQLFFRAQSGERLRLTARGTLQARLPVTDPVGLAIGGRLDAQVQIDGHLSRDLREADLSVRLDDLTTATFLVAPHTLNLALRDQQLQAASEQRDGTLGLKLNHDFGTGSSTLTVSAAELRVADVIQLKSPHAVLDLLLAAVVSGTGSLRNAPEETAGSGGVQYEVELSGSIPGGPNSPPGAITAALSGDGRLMQVAHLHADTANGAISFSGTVLHDGLLPEGELVVRAMDVGLSAPVDARLAVTRAGKELVLRSERIALGQASLHELQVNLRPATAAPFTYHYQLSAKMAQSAAGSIDASGQLNLAGNRRLSLAAAIDGIAADQAYRLLTPPAARQAWLERALTQQTLSGEIEASTDFQTWRLQAPAVQVRDARAAADGDGNTAAAAAGAAAGGAAAEQADHWLQFSLVAGDTRLAGDGDQRAHSEVRVQELAADLAGYRIRGSARLTGGDGGGLELETTLEINGEPYELRASISPAGEFHVTGTHELVVDGTFGGDRGVQFSGSASALPVPLPLHLRAAPLRTSLAFSGHYATTEDWSLESNDMILDDLPFTIVADAQFELKKLAADPQGVNLTDFTYQDAATRLVGETGQFTFDDRLETLSGTGKLSLSGSHEKEKYDITLTLRDGEVDAEVHGSGLPLARFGTFPLAGSLGGNAQITSRLSQPLHWKAAVELENGRLNADPVRLDADLEWKDGVLSVRDLTFGLLSHQLQGGSGEIDPQRGILTFETAYRAEYFGDQVEARLKLESENFRFTPAAPLAINGAPAPEATPLETLADGVSAVLTADALTVAGEPVPSWDLALRFERTPAAASTAGDAGASSGSGGGGSSGSSGGSGGSSGSAGSAGSSAGSAGSGSAGSGSAGSSGPPAAPLMMHFCGGPDDAFSGFLSAGGQFRLEVHDPYPVRGSVIGTYANSQVDAQVEVTHADTRMLNAPFANSPLVFTAGTTTGSARIVGPLNNPDFQAGSVRITGGSVTSRFTPEVVGPFEAHLSIEKKLLTIKRFSAQSDMPLPVTLEGTAEIEHWIPSRFRLKLKTTAEQGIPLAYQFGPLRYDGRAAGKLILTLDAGGVGLEGEVQAHSAEISLADLARTQTGRGPQRVKLDVSTGRRVEFTWPSPQLPILRVPLVPDEHIEIEFDRASGEFSVKGEVEVRGGELFYFNRQFLMREGRIRFAGDEIRFDPQVHLEAETRERDSAGNEVRIILKADTTLSAFSPDTVRLSTDPPRSRVAIESLVRGGTLLDGGLTPDPTTAGSAAAFSGDLLTQTTLLRPVERALRELLGVDFVSIRSPFVQNLVIDRLLEPQGTTFTPGSADLLDNTSFSLGKYFGSDLFLKMLLRLETPEVDVVGAAPLQPDLELSLQWETPFFLLEWSFLPQNPEALFVPDNSISVRWQVEY